MVSTNFLLEDFGGKLQELQFVGMRICIVSSSRKVWYFCCWVFNIVSCDIKKPRFLLVIASVHEE